MKKDMSPQDPRTVLRALELYLFNVDYDVLCKAAGIKRTDLRTSPECDMCAAWLKLGRAFSVFLSSLGENRDAFMGAVMERYGEEAVRDNARRETWPRKTAALEKTSTLGALMASDLKPKTASDRRDPGIGGDKGMTEAEEISERFHSQFENERPKLPTWPTDDEELAYKLGWTDAVTNVRNAIRANCTACKGTGYSDDVGGGECEYCGRPRNVASMCLAYKTLKESKHGGPVAEEDDDDDMEPDFDSQRELHHD